MNYDVLNSLTKALGNGIPVEGTEEYRFNCPNCPTPDHKSHMYVNIEKMVFICFRCDTKGQLKYLARKHGFALKVLPQARDWDRRVAEFFAGPQEVDDVSEVLEYPEHWAHIPEGHNLATQYLFERGIPQEDWEYFGLGIVHMPKKAGGFHQPRIFIPTFNEENCLVYYVARAFMPLDTFAPKYLNPRGVGRRNIIFNFHPAANDNDEIIICEGPISAMVAGRDAVATYGKSVTNGQINMLAAANVKRYHIAFDADAQRTAMLLAERLHRKGCEVSIVTWNPESGEDPADLGRYAFREALVKSTPFEGGLQVLRHMGEAL